ncbi:DeoR/GlpR transcriptional regulator [bacterium]|nr:DeoR/GlpR transcriptional regulator [bacterium]
MFTHERQKKIKEILYSKKSVSVPELSEQLDVSESTIRRDLHILEQNRLIYRTHGGAINIDFVRFEPSLSEKEVQFREEKSQIARRAVQMIREGDTIALDGGTTTLEIAKNLPNMVNLTVVTNSVKIIAELANLQDVSVVVTGGNLRRMNMTLIGPISNRTLKKLHIDKLFTGTIGLTYEEGLTTTDVIEAETKRAMIKKAKEVIVVADYSKIGKLAFANVASIDSIDKLITNTGISKSLVKKLQKKGIEIITV